MKTCTKCKQQKLFSEFGKRYDYPSKLLSWCNDCERDRKREAARKRFSNPEARAKESLRQKLWVHGLTEAQYRDLQDQHGGRCAICSSDEPLRIDHDHKTGKVRGLLCHHCNVALGHFNDSVQLIEKAIEYLCKNKSQHS